MACLLWEDTFYEDGVEIGERIAQLVPHVDAKAVGDMAVWCRHKMHLRHVPLLLVREMARGPQGHRLLVADILEMVIERPDEITEFLAIYNKEKRQPLSAQVKKGIAKAFTKFDAYRLAKYNRDEAWKLRDALFMSHAKPKDGDQALVWKQLVQGTLPAPDTWEVALSAGQDKKETFTRLIKEGKLGDLALLRNLRNMHDCGVDRVLIERCLQLAPFRQVLPFRFISAAKHAPVFEGELDAAMLRVLQGAEALPGRTALVIDTSGSMVGAKVSAKSEIDRLDAACGLAIILREIVEKCDVYTFSDSLAEVAPRHGFALANMIRSAYSGGTQLGHSLQQLKQLAAQQNIHYDRIIVITDEQAHDSVGAPLAEHGYMVNVACYQNGVGYGKWTHIDGWSEAIVEYIRAAETSNG